ncbi:conserved hypothetical protein [Hyella patelloides LEGE 07179]|uniref:Uncharacterized protein n=1 Tax=Hyella patelloides LEGE 07179 TaxID=945734 RepID=A0A563VVX3_9CYAN|nr:hypothetical protein [Hyella patelloides]VEP15566.1 conserved hypothetical protein [Hyella patelloides LEGE 07179]
MQVSEILQQLPGNLEWMVLFNLEAIASLTDETTIKPMFGLPAEIEIEPYSHVVLTSYGRCLASKQGLNLIDPFSKNSWATPDLERSLYEQFASQLVLFPVDRADCLGLGETSPFSPVLLHLEIESGYGEGKAIFQQQPSEEHYELLRAVGVQFLGGEQHDSYYLARFRNRLPVHIHAGILSHFKRTAHCNQFFLQHGWIDPTLEMGLLKAASSRINWAKNLSLKAIVQLSHQASTEGLAMTCQPPTPAKAYSFGDLVPLGFLLKTLNTLGEESEELKKLLESKRQGYFWSFHSNGLITSIDSALILQGFNEPKAVEALELFANGCGGYYPQLWAEDKQPHKMVITHSNKHWCQTDYASTCLVAALRQEANLTIDETTIDYLAAEFDNRSGLYFANPYLVDWMLARAISTKESTKELRTQLLSEILASINDDYSFGTYDPCLSTALGILSLAALGCRDRIILLAQLRLLELLEAERNSPEAIPFYSTLALDTQHFQPVELFNLILSDRQKRIISINNQYHGISYYLDSQKAITTALVTLALSESWESTTITPTWRQIMDRDSHPRYRCHNHSEYIAKFALPRYVAINQQEVVMS